MSENGVFSDSNYTPKEVFKELNRKSASVLADWVDPIGEEVKDLDRVLQTYSEYPIIPFFDNGDASLRLFRKMADLSPTHGSCIQSIIDYSLGGGIEASFRREEGFYLPQDDRIITEAEAVAVRDFIKKINPESSPLSLLKEIEKSAKNYLQNGNIFVRVDWFTVGGTPYGYINAIDTEKCRYFITRENEPKTILISPLWNYDYLNRHPPEFVGAYPNVTENEGVFSTVIHLKNETPFRDWYGQPESLMSLYFQYLEFQLGQYMVEGYGNDFIARVFFDVVAPPGNDENIDTFEANQRRTFTNRARNRKKILNHFRLPGQQKVEIHEFQANTEHEFHETMANEAERQIIKSHDWHYDLLGQPTPGNLGGNQQLKEIYRQKYFNVIAPKGDLFLRAYNMGLQIIGNFLGDSLFDDFAISPYNNFADYLSAEDEEAQESQPPENNIE